MIPLSPEQQRKKTIIEQIATLIGVDPKWAVSVAMTESSLGLHQLSPTGCKGVFQMSRIAMTDLLQVMEKKDDDIVDILCGIAFLYLLFKRHGSYDAATLRYCDPNDRAFYLARVKKYMEELYAS